MNRRALAGLGTAVLLGGCGATTAYASPDGRFSVEVTQSSHPPDRLWTVTVQVGIVARVRSVTVGCFSDEGVEGVPTGVAWTAPQTFVVRTTSELDVTVELDASGRPVRVIQRVDALRACPDA